MERLTSQKQIILEYLQSVKNHPTAEEVFEAVKKKLPRISLGTVYRNLETFYQRGLAKKIEGETKRFDGDISIHHHFICQKCKKVFDIFEKNKNLDKIFNNRLNGFKAKEIQIHGICKNCQK